MTTNEPEKRLMVGIIGNARDIPAPANKALFDAMCAEAERIITEKLGKKAKEVHLVSGGAAWGDHVAVTLYNRYGFKHDWVYDYELSIFLPCKMDRGKLNPENGLWEGERFFDDASRQATSTRSAPGPMTDRLHRDFERQTELDSISEIVFAENQGAVISESSIGFYERNTLVAEASDVLIAFTREPVEPTSGGTFDTWRKFGNKGQRFHVCLTNLVPIPAPTSAS